MKNKTVWIAETAVMIALLVALQWATKPLGQFVTGSCVNLVLVVLLYLLAGRRPLSIRSYLAVAAAAVCKFLVLFLLVTKVAIPSLALPEAAAATMSASFSWPQLITAAIGGVIAVSIAPVIRKALKR